MTTAQKWQAFAARFWAKVDRVNGPMVEGKPELGRCWPFTGALSEKRGGGKYGSVALPRIDGQRTIAGAHRVALALSTNGEMPAGKDCCHRCDYTICCNPDHLFWATHKANMQDYAGKYGGIGRKKISKPKYRGLFDELEQTA